MDGADGRTDARVRRGTIRRSVSRRGRAIWRVRGAYVCLQRVSVWCISAYRYTIDKDNLFLYSSIRRYYSRFSSLVGIAKTKHRTTNLAACYTDCSTLTHMHARASARGAGAGARTIRSAPHAPRTPPWPPHTCGSPDTRRSHRIISTKCARTCSRSRILPRHARAPCLRSVPPAPRAQQRISMALGSAGATQQQERGAARTSDRM